MDWNNIHSNWKHYKGVIQNRWGRLSNDDLDKINGDRKKLSSKIQVEYNYSKSEAEHNIDSFIADMDINQHQEKGKRA